MSSPRLREILASRVFKLVLAAAAGFVALALAALWGLGAIAIAQIDAAQSGRIQERLEFGTFLFEAEGPEAIIEAVMRSGRPIWDEDAIYAVLENDAELAVLRGPDDTVLAGYPGLYAWPDEPDAVLDHPEIFHPVTAEAITLGEGYVLAVGRFVPDDRAELQTFLRFVTGALLVIVLPLALITGFLLSRSVLKRVLAISQTADRVAAGALAERAAVTGAGDEFDKMAGALNRMFDQLEATGRNIEAVSIGVAHDLKTPLANLRGRLELIDRDRERPEDVARHAAAGEAHLGQVLGIFDALLRLGEVEAGQRRQAFRRFDLSALVAGMGESYAPLFEDADKSLGQAVAPGLDVQGDPDLIQQLIANLLDNALEHARDGARVQLSLTPLPEAAVLSVGDDGPGISPVLRDRVFERFFRADASRSRPGNGLGLSLVKAIADLHGATLELDPEAQGAVFTLRLPRG